MAHEAKTGLSNTNNRRFWWNNLVVNSLYLDVNSFSPEQQQAGRDLVAAMIASARRTAQKMPVTKGLYSQADFDQQAAHQNPFVSK